MPHFDITSIFAVLPDWLKVGLATLGVGIPLWKKLAVPHDLVVCQPRIQRENPGYFWNRLVTVHAQPDGHTVVELIVAK